MPSRTLRAVGPERPLVRPWQVWDVQLDPQVGREQAGRRPCIVVVGSTFACTALRDLVIVVPCTTTRRGLPHQPVVQLARPSVALCDHVTTISTDRLIRLLLIALSDDEVRAIRYAVRRMFA